MARVFIAFGSNIEPEKNIRQALQLLKRALRLQQISTVYRTPPLLHPEQPPFYNGVLLAETDLPPAELKHAVLQPIEAELGRRRSEDKFAPRTIDLDLLLYNDLVIETPDLIVPDPEITRRPFLARPLAELVPDLLLPGTQQPIAVVAADFAHHALEPLVEFTKALRKDLADETREP